MTLLSGFCIDGHCNNCTYPPCPHDCHNPEDRKDES